jgi:hypothetical protein
MIAGQRTQGVSDALVKAGGEIRDHVDQIKDADKIKRKHIHLEQPSHPPEHEKAQFMAAVAAEARAEFMAAVQEEHARSIVHPDNWGIDADAARIAAAAAEAAVETLRAGSGFEISFDDMTLDEDEDEAGGYGDEMRALHARPWDTFEVALHNIDAALPEMRFHPEGEQPPTRKVPARLSGGSLGRRLDAVRGAGEL